MERGRLRGHAVPVRHRITGAVAPDVTRSPTAIRGPGSDIHCTLSVDGDALAKTFAGVEDGDRAKISVEHVQLNDPPVAEVPAIADLAP